MEESRRRWSVITVFVVVMAMILETAIDFGDRGVNGDAVMAASENVINVSSSSGNTSSADQTKTSDNSTADTKDTTENKGTPSGNGGGGTSSGNGGTEPPTPSGNGGTTPLTPSGNGGTTPLTPSGNEGKTQSENTIIISDNKSASDDEIKIVSENNDARIMSEPQSVKVSLGITKIMIGDSINQDYGFKLFSMDKAPESGGKKGAELSTAEVGKTAFTVNTASFNELSFNEASANKIYYYLVSENKGGTSNNSVNGGTLSYDGAYYYLSVNSAASAAVKYKKAVSGDWKDYTGYEDLVFTNRYSKTGYTYAVLKLSGTATLKHYDGTAETNGLSSISVNVLSGNKVLAKGTADSSGNIKFAPYYISFNKAGTYTITISESNVPNNVNKAADKPMTITVSSDGTIKIDGTAQTALSFTLENYVKGFAVYKKTSAGAALAGASMKISSTPAGTDVSHVAWKSTTGAENVENLTARTYYLIETAAPDGYRKIGAFGIKVAADGSVTPEDKNTTSMNASGHTVTISDASINTSFTVEKCDMTDSSLIGGATLLITNAAGTTLKTLNTTAGTKYTVTGLDDGTYYLSEYQTPAGYEPITQFGFSIQSSKLVTKGSSSDPVYATNGNVIVAKDKRKTGDVTLYNRAMLNDTEYKELSGATFELYSINKHTSSTSSIVSTITSTLTGTTSYPYKYATKTTDDDGIINITGLPWDSYYFKETKPASGYTLRSDTYCKENFAFTINGSDLSKDVYATYAVGTGKSSSSSSTTSSSSSYKSTVNDGASSGLTRNGSSSDTGDNMNITFWLLIMFGSGVVTLVMIDIVKRQQIVC